MNKSIFVVLTLALFANVALAKFEWTAASYKLDAKPAANNMADWYRATVEGLP
jgi:hypothetical protein